MKVDLYDKDLNYVMQFEDCVKVYNDEAGNHYIKYKSLFDGKENMLTWMVPSGHVVEVKL